MEDILCDISAFRFHRTPPQVLMLCPPYPDRATDNNRAGFRNHILTHEILGTPIHLLATDRKRRLNNVSTVSRLVTNELPFGCIQQTDLGISTASPLYSLFNLASHVDENHLVMAMYEFCGTFSIFRPSPVVEALLDSIDSSELLPRSFGWRRVKSSSGRKTDLWRREPLIELGELGQFADAMKSERGGRRFARAAKRVTGVTASPFEVQASMLFSTQRCKGGEGFSGFVNNERIPLSTSARRIYGKSTCCADLLFDVPSGASPLIVECQGKVVHDDYDSAISDSDRTTALQQMGFTVMPLTYRQISDRANFDTVRRMVARQIGVAYRSKNSKEIRCEIDLRRNIFIDWTTLGR